MIRRRIDWLSVFNWGVVGVASGILVYELVKASVLFRPVDFSFFLTVFIGLLIFVYRWIRYADEIESKNRIIYQLKQEILELGGSLTPWMETDENEPKEWESADEKMRLNEGAKAQLKQILGDKALE